MSGWALIGWALLALMIVTPVYWVACMLWPFTHCRRCGGSGRRRSPFGGKNYGRCRRCKGNGERLRLGRKVVNWMGVAKKNMVG